LAVPASAVRRDEAFESQSGLFSRRRRQLGGNPDDFANAEFIVVVGGKGILMRAILAAMAALLLLSSYAAAGVTKPPKRYDHAYRGLIIVEKSYGGIDLFCRARFPGSRFRAASGKGRITGCAEIGNGRRPCRIYVPKRGGVITDAYRTAVIRHERAHCNGWPSSHPRS